MNSATLIDLASSWSHTENSSGKKYAILCIENANTTAFGYHAIMMILRYCVNLDTIRN